MPAERIPQPYRDIGYRCSANEPCRVADRPSFPVFGPPAVRQQFSHLHKLELQDTRAGSVVSGSNDGCDDIGGKFCTSGAPVASSGVKVGKSVPVGTGALAVTWPTR